jgi:hypothetical protein
VNVSKGDDTGLLEGSTGLAAVEKKVREVTNAFKGLEVYTIGLGRAGQTYDPEALQRLSYPADGKNALDAENQAQLERLFRLTRVAQLNRVFLTFGPVRPSKDQVTSPMAFKINMRTPAGVLSAETPRYEPPVLGLPSWDGALTPNENLDFLKWQAVIEEPPGLPPWLSRLIVFVTFAMTLALMWFGIPRLIWPERYVPRPSFQVAPGARGARASAGRPGSSKSVTISGRAVMQQRPGAGPPTASPRLRDAGPSQPAPPGAPAPRPRGSPPAPPQRPAREPFVRDAGDATVFVPPDQNRRGGDN